MKCRYKSCTNDATDSLEAVGKDGILIDVAGVCSECKCKFLEGWDRMSSDAEALKDKGVPKSELDRIMLARVGRGEYTP